MDPKAPRQITYKLPARKRLVSGAEQFAKAVCVTYGPQGRLAILDRPHGLISTKDGVTVAREIDLPDPIENMACQVLKQACIKVNNEAGDGTTTAACLGAALLRESMVLVEGGFNPVLLARGMMEASREAIECVRSISRRTETKADLERVALIASNGDADLASKLAEAVMAVGKNGTVSIEDGKGVETKLEFKEGMEIDRGVCSTTFLGTQVERELPGPLVAVIAATLHSLDDVRDLMETASTFGGRELLLFADEVIGEALATMTLNDQKGIVRCVAVRAPGFHDKKVEHLGDIAALAGATLIDPRAGGQWTTWDPEWFGMLDKALVREKQTILWTVDEASDLIRERIEYITNQMPLCTSDYDRDRLNERRAALEGGLCVMQIGAYTEMELKEKRARVEDALGSIRAALTDGIVPGGGIAYLEASEGVRANIPEAATPEQGAGWRIVAEALRAPLRLLVGNAGKDGAYMVEHLQALRQTDDTGWLGWDALTDKVRNLGEGDLVVDPTKVVCSVIEAAVSAAATLITSEVTITGGAHG